MVIVIILLTLAWVAGVVFFYLVGSALDAMWHWFSILLLLLWPIVAAIILLLQALQSPKEEKNGS